jgi:hypothetical protein
MRCHDEQQKIRGQPTAGHAVDMGGSVTVELLISGSQVRCLRGPSRNLLKHQEVSSFSTGRLHPHVVAT